MMETFFLNTSAPDIAASITGREYNRLLQLPRERQLEGDLLDRAQSARNWYASHGKPFVASRRVELLEIRTDSVILESSARRSASILPAGEESAHNQSGGQDARATTILNSLVLAQRLRAGEAHALMIIAASAGSEVAQEISRHWSEGRPDEAFFLDRFAVAITERLLFWSAATLCRASETAHETLMPHLSPGCGNWDLADQHKLMALLSGGTHIGPLQMLPSGALEPQHSVLAAMGVTHRNFATTPEHLCRSCDLNPCTFRRAPFSGDAFLPMEIQ